MNVPSDLKYMKTDEWIKLEGNIATIGITDYAQDQLSDIVFWEALARRAGEQLKKGKLVYIEGKLVTRKFKDNENQERRITEVRVNYYRLLERSENAESEEELEK